MGSKPIILGRTVGSCVFGAVVKLYYNALQTVHAMGTKQGMKGTSTRLKYCKVTHTSLKAGSTSWYSPTITFYSEPDIYSDHVHKPEVG